MKKPEMGGKVKGRLPHILELDGIRGLAAITVFMHHTWLTMMPDGFEGPWSAWTRFIYVVSYWGKYGVDLFFVLSGFLITCILLEEKGNPNYYKDFYWKRALRILPLYVCCLLGSLIVWHSFQYVLLSALFLANFASLFHLAGTGPFWTLAIEEQFYLLWPTAVRRRSIPTLMRWSIYLGLLAVVLRLLFAWRGHYNYEMTFLRCDGLAFGAGLACFYRKSGDAPKRHPATIVLGAMMALGCVFFTWSSGLEKQSFAFSSALLQTSVVLMSGAVIGLVILYAKSPVLAVLRSRILVFFGLISYAFYMLHLYVVWGYDRFVGRPPLGEERACWMRFGICLAVTVLLSVASRYAIELPAMRLRKRVLSHPQEAPPQGEWPPVPLARMD